MTELRTTHWTDNSIQSAAMRNASERAGVAEIQDMMMYALWGEVPSGAGGGIMGGLEVSRVVGQLQSTVSPGWGWYYDSALSAPQSKFGVLVLKTSATVNHDPGHATNARIDIITIQCVSDTDTETSVSFWQAAPQNIDIQRGAQPTITVTAGVDDGSLAVPATPSGHRLLATVQVPATATDLDAATYADARERLGASWRDSQRPIRHKARSTSDFLLAEVLKETQGAGAGSKLGWKYSEDWPTFVRSTAASGESNATLYPMVVPGGRTWWRTVPLAGADTGIGGWTIVRNFGNGNLSVARVGTGSDGNQVNENPEVDARGLEVVGAKLRYEVTDAFDCGWVSRKAYLRHIAADGTLTTIGETADIDTNTAHGGTVQPLAFTMASTPVIAEGDQLNVNVALVSSATGTATGEILLYNVSLQFREGRTS